MTTTRRKRRTKNLAPDGGDAKPEHTPSGEHGGEAAVLPVFPAPEPPATPPIGGELAVNPAIGGLSRDEPEAVDLSEAQVAWITERLSTGNDDEACALAGITPAQLADWRSEPRFAGYYEVCRVNKREAFRKLGEQLLPRALSAIHRLLASENVKANAEGVKLLLRSQGLLIDVQRKEDPEMLARLLDELRTPTLIEAIDVTVS